MIAPNAENHSGENSAGVIRRSSNSLVTLGSAAVVAIYAAGYLRTRSAAEIAAIESGNALASIAVDPSRLLVAFTGSPDALQGLGALSELVHAPERLHLGEHAAYLWCASGILESKAGAALLGKVGRAATTRNWATVLKIASVLRQNGV